MAKKTTLQLWTGSGWEDLFPKTRSDMVILGNGENNLEHRLNMVEAVARGAQQSLAFENYQEAIEYLNNLPYMQLSIGQNIYIRSLNVPDLWVFNTIDIPYSYPYTNDQNFITYISSKWGGQVGHYILSPLESSKSVITNDASSQVLAGGVHQSVWNADTKLDKVTSVTGGYYAYAINGSGDQIIVRYSSGAIPDALALRDNAGAISVGEPVSGNNATTKNYVDSNFVTKNAPKGTAVKLYGETSEGSVVHRLVNTAATPTQGTIPIYRENGTLAAGTPTETYHAANKGYVDNGFLAKTTVTSEMLLTQKVNGSTDKLGFDIAAKPYYIVRRDAKGDVLVNDTPSSTSAAVNQKYVDDAIANAGGGGGAELYLHTITYNQVGVGPTDKSSKMFIINNSPNAITTVTYELLQAAVSVRLEVLDTYGDYYTNTVRGYTRNSIYIHGTETPAIGSLGLSILKNITDTVTKL